MGEMASIKNDKSHPLDRVLKTYGRWAIMPTLISVGLATKDDERLALAEYQDAYAAALWWLEQHAPPAAS